MISRVFILFILVGMLNTVFGYSLYALLIYLNFHYSAAVFLSTVLGVLFNFKTTGNLVFKSNDNALIVRFVAVYVVIYLVNLAGLRIYRIFDDNMYLAGLLMIVPSALLAFVLHSRFVFKGNLPAQGGPAAAEHSSGATEHGRSL